LARSANSTALIFVAPLVPSTCVKCMPSASSSCTWDIGGRSAHLRPIEEGSRLVRVARGKTARVAREELPGSGGRLLRQQQGDEQGMMNHDMLTLTRPQVLTFVRVQTGVAEARPERAPVLQAARVVAAQARVVDHVPGVPRVGAGQPRGADKEKRP